MIARCLCLAAALGLLLHPATSTAQSDVSQGPPPPAGRTDNIFDGVSAEFSVSEKESQAALEIGDTSAWQTGTSAQGVPEFLNANWTLRLSLPVGGQDDISSSDTLLGLLDGPKLTLHVSLLGFRSANLRTPRFVTLMSTAFENCRNRAATTEARGACSLAPDPEFALDHSGASPAEVNRSIYSWMWRIGLEGGIQHNEFDFVDPTTLRPLQDSKFDLSAAVVGTLYPPDAMSAIIGRVEYERTWEAADEEIICRPVVVDPDDDCVSGAPTRPEQAERLNLSLEYRRVFDTGRGGMSLAMSPRGTIDALSGDFEAELPIYVIPRDEDFPITPGVTLGYSTDEDEVTLGIFLRTSFSFAD
ncbi:MAG: hypothetical protein M3177_08700 [Pseudomonadota bacterium]|nr:hypothetical protein [Pseudomonadota bacterium]